MSSCKRTVAFRCNLKERYENPHLQLDSNMTHATDTAGKLISWENKPVVVVVGSGFYISILTVLLFECVSTERKIWGFVETYMLTLAPMVSISPSTLLTF